jgi:hypothetical protein
MAKTPSARERRRQIAAGTSEELRLFDLGLAPAGSVRPYGPPAVLHGRRFLCYERLTKRQQSRVEQIADFFTDAVVRNILVPFISEDANSSVSKRTVEWLVVNYAKERNICYMYPVLGTTGLSLVNVSSIYQSSSAYWGRDLFSPFRRGVKLHFVCDGTVYYTTPAQLNFVYFSYIYGILDYAAHFGKEIRAHYKRIKAAVKKEKEDAKRSGQKRKRRQLTRGSRVGCRIYEVDTSLTCSGSGEVPVLERVVMAMEEDDGAPATPTDESEPGPAVSDPAVSDPAVSDPAVSDPAVSDPAVSDPAVEMIAADDTL